MFKCGIAICFKRGSGEFKGVGQFLQAGVDKHKKIAAAVLVPMFGPPRVIVDIEAYMAGDCFIRNFPLLIADDHVGQRLR